MLFKHTVKVRICIDLNFFLEMVGCILITKFSLYARILKNITNKLFNINPLVLLIGGHTFSQSKLTEQPKCYFSFSFFVI